MARNLTKEDFERIRDISPCLACNGAGFYDYSPVAECGDCMCTGIEDFAFLEWDENYSSLDLERLQNLRRREQAARFKESDPKASKLIESYIMGEEF